MRVLRAIAVRLRALVTRRSTDVELDEEMRYHLERDVDRRVARGETPMGARDAARRAFGNVTVLTEQARGASRVELLEQLRQDVRYALRGFRRSPRFALTVVLTIGLGLGLVTSVFTFFDAYVLRPLQVRDPRSLYEMRFRDQRGGERELTWNEYAALTRSNPAFTETFAFRWVVVHRDGEPMIMQAVTGDFFQTLGVSAALGRMVEPTDSRAPGSSPVLVVSHRTWRAKFGGDSTIIGRRLLLRGRTFEIIGVARQGFDDLSDVPPDFWVPITMLGALEDGVDLFEPGDRPLVRVVGRLTPGMSEASATRALSTWAALLTANRPKRDKAATVGLESRATAIYMSPETMVKLSPLFAGFALVLLIACANVANMMLARGMARQREIGIRLALGAARARLVRQLLTEALLLAVPAGVMGLVVSRSALSAGMKLLLASLPEMFVPYIRVVSLVPDTRVFAFLFVAAIASAVAFGLMPALQTTRTNVIDATRGELSPVMGATQLRNALVIGQIAMCATLLITSGVLLRGSSNLQDLDIGFRTDGLVEVSAPASLRGVVTERLRAEPGVTAVEATSHAPFDGRFPQIAVTGASNAPTATAGIIRVSPGYFSALGIRVVRGRTFSADEARAGDAVVVVSEAAARQLWPRGDAVGATLRLGSGGGDSASATRTVRVIGVVSNVIAGFIGESREHPAVYEGTTVEASGTTLIVGGFAGAGAARRSMRTALERVDPSGSVELRPMEESVIGQVYPFRAAHWIASSIGVIALMLTITGIYGVLAYVVALRQKEIGIRVALGATRRVVVGLVVRQSVRLAVVGVVLGSVMALGLSRFIAAYLPMMPAFDVVALGGGIAVVVLAALGAAYVPSRRAAAVDPVETLRN